ncbi:MAG: hypothetical protein VB877_03710 [Pirellulaceae bacterium]
MLLTDFEEDHCAFSFQSGGLLKLSGKDQVEKFDLFLEMPMGLATNNSQLDDDFPGKGGIVDLGRKPSKEIREIPLYGYRFALPPKQIRPGHTYCVRTADGEQYGLFQVIEFDSEAATLKITWRYPAGKPVPNVSTGLSEQDVETIAAQPHQPILNNPHFISTVLKPGIWERIGKLEVRKTANHQITVRTLTKKIKHVHGKYVVMENTDAKGTKVATEVQSYDRLANTMHSTFVNGKGSLRRLVGVPDPKTHAIKWKMIPAENDPRTTELTITCAKNGLSAQAQGRTYQGDTLISIFTGDARWVGDLPASDLAPANK